LTSARSNEGNEREIGPCAGGALFFCDGVNCLFTPETYSAPMKVPDRRFVVAVTFDERRGGYIATAPGLETVSALSLLGLRARIEAQLPPSLAVKLELDRAATRESHSREIAASRLADRKIDPA
jgi:hypothetical protein